MNSSFSHPRNSAPAHSLAPSLFLRSFHHSIHPYPLSIYSCQTVNHSIRHPSIHPSIHPLIHPAIHPSSHSSSNPSIQSSIHPSIQPVIHPSIHSSIHPFIHPSIHPSIRIFIHLSPNVFIHSLPPYISFYASLFPSIIQSAKGMHYSSFPALSFSIIFVLLLLSHPSHSIYRPAIQFLIHLSIPSSASPVITPSIRSSHLLSLLPLSFCRSVSSICPSLYRCPRVPVIAISSFLMLSFPPSAFLLLSFPPSAFLSLFAQLMAGLASTQSVHAC